MKIIAISGSYRKGKTTDSLIEKALAGAQAINKEITIEKISLIDKDIKYCKNCMVRRNDVPDKRIAKCVINDDMQAIYRQLDEADGYVFGCPVNMGAVTALMKTFLERVCWVLARPGNAPLKGCPEPRNPRKKKAIIIVTSGIVPPIMRIFCDGATSVIKSVSHCSLNAKVIGSFYAGAVENKGTDTYFSKAEKLGQKLAKDLMR